jgi:hypothetical protein
LGLPNRLRNSRSSSLVRHAACFLLPAQRPQPPFTGLSRQFIVL